MMRIIVLGAGFGGLEVTTRLSETLGDDVDVVLVDAAGGFAFGYSKLDVLFGRAEPAAVVHPYRDLVKPGVRFVQSTVRAIDPVAKRVETDAGSFVGDAVVIALGADLDPEATPGLSQGAHEFYSVAGAAAARDVLAAFPGGRVIVGVVSTPYKCPPAPSETALLLHDHLVAGGVRERSEIALVVPMPAPVPPSPDASKALLEAFGERGIAFHPNRTLRSIDPRTKVATFADGGAMPFDLFLAVPAHRAPSVVEASGLCVDGWIAVDPRTLETRHPGVFAIGDVAASGTPKAGVFAEGQAEVVADAIIARARGDLATLEYGGSGTCYLEFGAGRVGRVDITFAPGRPPVGRLLGPSPDLAAHKEEFGASRVRRWFGRVTASEG
jgi:sulfide:quinone oxidoreductase